MTAPVKAHPIPPPRGNGLEREAVQTAWKAKELQREAGKVEARGAERLVLAQERYQAFRAQQQKAREAAAEALRRDISRAQEHLWRTQLNTEETLQDLETQRQSWEEEEKDSKVARQKAQQRVYTARENVDAYAAQADAEADAAAQAAEQEVEASKAAAKAAVAAHREDRSRFQDQTSKDLAAKKEQAESFVEDVIAKTKSCMRQMETERHHAAMHMDLVAERHQATKTEAQARMKLHEEKSKKQAKELEHMTHQLRLRSDEALAEKMAGTQRELTSAKAFCAQVQTDMEEAIRSTKLAAMKIEAEAAANTFEEQRKLQDLENNALQSFKGSREEAQGAWDETASRRKALQEELDEIHAQYQKLHDDTRSKMTSIMAQWNESRQAMEKSIADFEVKRKDAFEELEVVMQRTKEKHQVQNQAIRQSCVHAVAECKEESEKVVFATYEAAVDAARVEEAAAAAALAEAQRWKDQIPGLEAEADAEIEAFLAEAAVQEEQLRRDSEAQVSLSKRLTQTAHEEEKVYITETSAAWARVRKACYQLRLASLHDFAKGIASGGFDQKLKMDDE